MAVLDTISGPRDLRRLSDAELETLASEIRDRLITSCAPVGGHLGPNLGVVELTMAIHRTFDSPRDRVVCSMDPRKASSVLRCYSGPLAQRRGCLRYEPLLMRSSRKRPRPAIPWHPRNSQRICAIAQQYLNTQHEGPREGELGAAIRKPEAFADSVVIRNRD